jgi:hypothetical protein
MKIKFNKKAQYKSVNPKELKDYTPGELSYVVKTYEEGKVYEMDEEFAKRFLKRQVAERVSEDARARSAPEPEVVTENPLAKTAVKGGK